MAKSLGPSESKQAPRFHVVILAALEELLTDLAQPVFFRIMAWWPLLQSWGALRFADHRGPELRNIHTEGGSLIAKLTRSIGTDKLVSSRLVIVDSEAYVRTWSWVVERWRLLQEKAPYQRDYLQKTSVRHCLRRAESALGLVVISRLPAFRVRVPTFLDATQRRKLSADSSVGLERADARKEPTGWLGPQKAAKDTTDWQNSR